MARVPTVAKFWSEGRRDEHIRNIAQRVNGVLDGKTNNVTSVTLSAGATTTTLSDSRITADTTVTLTPKTASAAAATGIYATTSLGKLTVGHNSDGAADRTFGVVLHG